MIVTRTIAETRAALRSLPRPLGFTPTMGALHNGHLSLVDAAKTRCASVAASLFVNPTQFGRDEDLGRYPRDEARDLQRFEGAGVDVVFAPNADEMYPEGFSTGIHVAGALTATYEGASRSSHFDGVAIIVTKLLGVVQPDVLFLGEKDAQQLAVIRRVVHDLDLTVEVASIPTVREPDGLAMSSRNAYLTAEQRAVAPDLYRALLAGRAAAGAPAATTKDVVVAATTALLMPGLPLDDAERVAALRGEAPPAAPRFDLDYLAIVDADTFRPQSTIGPRSLLIAAARLGAIRLIDNVSLSPSAYPATDATT
ncbi:MAG: pantoate--beta-alanine ligase [Actinobacteria bacterium]|nr:pantoate--beta-alanine ligase [Actinomycetota bacterium]